MVRPMEKKMKNPLIKRIPRELLGEWQKYLIVSLFLILVIGFVSGMFVANGSMMAAVNGGKAKYKLEDGHFELENPADESLLAAIASGEKADVKAYYTAEAKKELDEGFEKEFQAQFTAEFAEEFDSAFVREVKAGLAAQGLQEAEISALLPAAVEQAKQSGAYQSAYDEAYQAAYDEAYQKAYDQAWREIQAEIDEQYADAEEKYELNDPDFQPVPVKVYENFYRNESEDNDLDGVSDGTVRVFAQTEEVNLACLMDGRFPAGADEIAIDRMHADNAGVQVGDFITVGGRDYRIVGLIAYVNYATLHEKTTDFMFDALKFNVAMVTQEGFDRLAAPIHYAYAWHYETAPGDEQQEKALSDGFLPALLTQTLTRGNELTDYLPAYANSAIHFAPDDMGSDMAMGGVLLDILIVIIAFIFAVTVSNTITKEAKTIGTLLASGYTRGELVRHYLAMPVIVTLFSAAVGNALGYTVFKYVVVSMYYNSYSLPTYETLWNTDAFVKTTCIPVALMLAVNLVIIAKELRHTPLEFLRGDLKRSRKKKAVRLPRWRFFSRFRLRIIFQNIPNYLILFFGIFFIMVMLAMAVGLPVTLDYYQENAGDMMFAQYQYVLKSCWDEDGRIVTTAQSAAEEFSMASLLRKSAALDEEISAYGIVPGSRYVQIADLQNLEAGEVYVSSAFRDKYGLSLGDTVTLDEKYEQKHYDFRVAGFYEQSLSLAVFMPMEQFRSTFDMEQDEFTGFLSDTALTDLDEDKIATVITQRDITKMCDQLDHSMGAYMQYFQVLCVLLSAVLLYLLTKIIIEKNGNAISMAKILGYENGEIARLYLLSTTIVLLLADAVSVFLGELVMGQAWRVMMQEYNGWFTFRIGPEGYLKMFLFVLLGYLLVAAADFRRIQKIPMDQALKNVE